VLQLHELGGIPDDARAPRHHAVTDADASQRAVGRRLGGRLASFHPAEDPHHPRKAGLEHVGRRAWRLGRSVPLRTAVREGPGLLAAAALDQPTQVVELAAERPAMLVGVEVHGVPAVPDDRLEAPAEFEDEVAQQPGRA
jgi:hypothetical protein